MVATPNSRTIASFKELMSACLTLLIERMVYKLLGRSFKPVVRTSDQEYFLVF